MTTISDDALRAMETKLLAMPPVRALELRILGHADGHLRLEAPLATNVNDKGSAFGGSLVSLMTLAAWGLTTLQVEESGIEADVYVADTQVRYLAPLLSDLKAEAWLEDGGSWETFINTLRNRGRARATLMARVLLPDGGTATEARARYVAIQRPAAA